MPWGPAIDSVVLAIHAALMPTSDGEGEILYFGGDQHDQALQHANSVDASRRFDCGTGTVTYVRSPTNDVFCSGHAFLADGRLLIAGGTSAWTGDPAHMDVHTGHFRGHRRAWVYSPSTQSFWEVAPMRPEPGQEATDRGGGRWYPTLVTLATGEILAIAGHPLELDSRHYNNTPERYLPALNEWRLLPPLGNAAIEHYYPRMHLLPDGEVFISSAIAQLSRNIKYNPWTGARTEVCDLPAAEYHAFGAPSVLLPLLPGEGYKPRILLCGGAAPQKINLAATTPAWTAGGSRSGSASTKRRENSCAVILPTGQVLLTGGVEQPRPEIGVREPEIYDPAIDWSVPGGAYRDNGSDAWTTIEEPSQEVRNYHSTALLMPDGRVWTGGSSRNANPGHPANSVLNMQVFTPPYPSGTRPTITACPSSFAYGQRFDVTSPQASTIQRVALVRCGSVTHAFDSDQRYVGLTFTRTGNTLTVTAPPHGGIAPPGYYLLFLVDNAGRPCDRGRFVRVGGDMYVVTDRSFFSEMEVQTLTAPARFFKAFYVIFDDYLPSETGLPAGPTVSFQWADGGGAVPGMAAELAETMFETGSATPDVSQRAAFEYTVRFDSTAAFSTANLGTDEERDISVVVTRGSVQSRGRMTLFKKRNPYMRDGDPHWLSVDLRVVQMTPGQRLAGVSQGAGDSDGVSFVQQVLTNFNGRPEDDTHPFHTISTSQETSRLELATHRGGQPVFNYAFAKVRLRAPATISATDVRVFFRLFTTAATSLEFNTSTTYRRHGNGPTATPLLGVVGGAIASIPFFATARTANMESQTDTPNRRTLTGVGATEDTAYFGCWLDFNRTTPRFPNNPGTSNGPFSGTLKSIQDLVRGLHQCLVAEVHYTDVPVPYGATPGSTDKLAQRNLAIVESSNPTTTGSHIVPHTFEIAPSSAMSLGGWIHMARNPGAISEGAHLLAAAPKRGVPDELMIRFYDLPRDSIVTLYLPEVDVDEILQAASVRNGPGMLRRVDDKTIQCKVGDVAFIPIPGGEEINIPGLLTVELPPGITQGQVFKVTVHQISGRDRRIIGSFQMTIPVRHGEQLLEREEHNLAVLSHIGSTIPAGDRWRRVFDRYLGLIGDRVRGFGGDPDEIESSPAGTGKPKDSVPEDDGGRTGARMSLPCCFLAWAVAFFLGLAIFSYAVDGKDWVEPVRIGATALFAGLLVWFWCKCKPTRCDLGGVIAAGGVLGALAIASVLLADESADAGDVLANRYAGEILVISALVSAVLLLLNLCTSCEAPRSVAAKKRRPASNKEVAYFFRYTTRWLIGLLVLALLYGWLYRRDKIGDIELNFDELDPVGGILPLAVPWFGALGAVTASLYGIMKHATDWDPKWNYWHLARPVVGAVLGTIAFLILLTLAEIANGDEDTLPTTAMDRPDTETLVLYFLAAFIVGYRENTFQELVRRVSDIVFKPGEPDPASDEDQKGSAGGGASSPAAGSTTEATTTKQGGGSG